MDFFKTEYFTTLWSKKNTCESKGASNDLFGRYSQFQIETSQGVSYSLKILEHAIHTSEIGLNLSLFLLQEVVNTMWSC